MNTNNYKTNILSFAKIEGQKLSEKLKRIFQQDGAKAFISNETQDWCRNNF